MTPGVVWGTVGVMTNTEIQVRVQTTEGESLTFAADGWDFDGYGVLHVTREDDATIPFCVATFACGGWVCVSRIEAPAPITVGQVKVKVDLDEEDFANQIEAIARNARQRFRAAMRRS